MPDPDLYRPSNGTEGEGFRSIWCEGCVKMPLDCGASGQCRIMIATHVYKIDDPKYPKQWQYVDGKPVCTAYVSRDDCNAERRKNRRGTADRRSGELF